MHAVYPETKRKTGSLSPPLLQLRHDSNSGCRLDSPTVRDNGVGLGVAAHNEEAQLEHVVIFFAKTFFSRLLSSKPTSKPLPSLSTSTDLWPSVADRYSRKTLCMRLCFRGSVV